MVIMRIASIKVLHNNNDNNNKQNLATHSIQNLATHKRDRRIWLHAINRTWLNRKETELGYEHTKTQNLAKHKKKPEIG